MSMETLSLIWCLTINPSKIYCDNYIHKAFSISILYSDFQSVIPLLYLCDTDCFILKTYSILRNHSAWELSSFRQNLLQKHCSGFSAFFENWNSTELTYTYSEARKQFKHAHVNCIHFCTKPCLTPLKSFLTSFIVIYCSSTPRVL